MKTYQKISTLWNFLFPLLLLGSCQNPTELVDAFPDHTFFLMREMGQDVRISFTGPNMDGSQLISKEDRESDSLFVLLAPHAVRNSRAVRDLTKGFGDDVVTFCVKGCAQVLKWRDQEMWIEGEICRKGMVATRGSFEYPVAYDDQGLQYKTEGLTFPGRFDFPDFVTCYKTYFYYNGEIDCRQTCQQCGIGEFSCRFFSENLGQIPVEMPESDPDVTSLLDCDPFDHNDCGLGGVGGGVGGGGGPI